ncbi:MAG: hypothetical protein ACXWOV_16195, partial [Isosphaeraceae bacterium]
MNAPDTIPFPRRVIANNLGAKGLAAVLIAGITMWLWDESASVTGLQPALLGLGLDQERAIVVVNLMGAAIAAAIAVLAANPTFVVAWASGALWCV